MLSFFQDVRFALRQLRRSPGYAAVAIVTLALGIGANTAIFLLTYSIVLKSLPVPHPGQLIRYTFQKGDSDLGLSWKQYLGLRKRQGVAVDLFAWSSPESTLRRGDQTQKVRVGMATGSVFDVLQLHPYLGRGFDPKAGEPNRVTIPEALLTYDYWRTAFNGDPNVIGTVLHLDSATVPVIGVLSPGFDGIAPENPVKMLLPMGSQRILQPGQSALDMDGAFWLTVMGRLRPGATLRGARANLAVIATQVNEDADPSHKFLGGGFFGSFQLGVESGRSGRSWLRWKYSKPLMALEGLCGLMMLLCAVNVALVILSRVSGRTHEFAMRSALGASRQRLLRQVLAETALLGFLGMGAGAVLGWELARSLVGMISEPGLAPVLELRSGFVVFFFAAGLSTCAALLAGLWPALRAAHTAPSLDLKQTGSGRRSARLGRWIIPTQVALGIVLLNSALLLSSTLMAYLREHSGFAAGNTVVADLDLDDAGVPKTSQPARALEFLHQVQSMPGVGAAAIMNMAPLGGGFTVTDFYSRNSRGGLHVNRQTWPEETSTDYFRVMGTRILAGRGFIPADRTGDRVCILGASAASYFFPSGGASAAIGQYLNDGDGREASADRSSCRIIGIAEDARFSSMLDAAPITVYQPIERETADAFTYAALGVRAATPQLAADAIRRASLRVFPTGPVSHTWLFSDAVNYSLSRQRLLSSVSGGFAILALALVAIGLYGILARTVTERRREIGIRMALGARRQQIVSALARTAALRIAIGVVAGAALAAGVGRLLQSLLYGVTAYSPVVAFATLVLLLGVLAMAFVFPAGRAASVDPMEAIRDE